MSDEAIPEVVTAKARVVYDALGRGSSADEDTIARAILAERAAERRRCVDEVLALAAEKAKP